MSDEIKTQLIALLPRLRRFAFGLTGSLDDADDLVQAACERALNRLDQWQPGTRLDSWMFRIIQNLRIDILRTRQSRTETIDLDSYGDLPDNQSSQEPEALQMLETVTKAIEKLPEDQRAVLLIVTVDGFSYQEAAEILDVPVGTIMSRLARARKQLHSLVHGKDKQ